jgi:hypothetical protein
MEISEKGELLEETQKHPAWIRIPAVFLGYVLHPVLMVGWTTLYMLFVNEQIFAGEKAAERIVIFLRLISTTTILPIVTVLLLRGLGFISTIRLKTQQERIIPLVACITFFFWSYYVARQLNDPPELRAFLLAMFICSSAALMLNIYQKVSLHMQSIGVVVAFFVLLLFQDSMQEPILLSASILLAGLSGSGRLITFSHKPAEVWTGFLTGFLIQLVAWWIVYS